MLAVPVPEVIDQVPPAVVFVNAGVAEPAQTIDAPPAIADTAGLAFTVSVIVFE